MIEKSMQIGLSGGMDARPIAVLVQMASKYESSVYIESVGKKVNVKSIMGMMSIGLTTGDSIKLLVDGKDEEKAVSEIEEYLTA